MKRVFDIIVSLTALAVFLPILGIAAIAISIQDGRSPFFIGSRIGKDEKKFRFIKLRSMKVGSDSTGVDTTVDGDPRITWVGHIIRRTKIDELPGFWHVLMGEMSLVGPRPNLESEVQLYTTVERRLLSVPPGITDISSIVFSNMSEILQDANDPNIAYGQLVRPWKSRLGLWYVDRQSLGLDISILVLTFVSLFSRTIARRGTARLLRYLDAPDALQQLPLSTATLEPIPPPGSDKLLTRKERAAIILAADNNGTNNS